jgi:hypothetical protein
MNELPKSPEVPKIQIEKLRNRWFIVKLGRSLSAIFGNFGISGNFLCSQINLVTHTQNGLYFGPCLPRVQTRARRRTRFRVPDGRKGNMTA